MNGSGDDHERTIFGAAPGRADQAAGQVAGRAGGRGGGQGSDSPFAGGAPVPSDRTVIGAAAAAPRPEVTWIGGGTPQSTQAWPPAAPAGHGPAFPQSPDRRHLEEGVGSIGRPAAPEGGFFPQYHDHQPVTPHRAPPRIALQDALRSSEIGAGSASNPLLASAASLLILLGRLRSGMVELQVAPLMQHVTTEIERFHHNAAAAGLDPHEVLVAKYALSGTADDIVQNLPGADHGNWQQYSMVARFFHKRDSGVGFFQEAEKAMQVPAQRYNLLELMLVCMSLGFEGQFRTMPQGATELARIRKAIHETLRRVHPRPDEDISVIWAPVVQDQRRRFAALPLPLVLGGAGLAVVALFAGLTTWISRDGADAAGQLRLLHQGAPAVAIQRIAPGPAYAAPLPQLDRIRAALAPELQAGTIRVDAKGDYIAIRVGNLHLFDLGKTDIKPEFIPLAARIAEVLQQEGGPVLVQGFSDSLPLSGRGFFKDNYQLSQARAQAVSDLLAGEIGDVSRIKVQGRGPEDPVGDNATPEGRAQNRRVEVMLAREGTYGPALDPGTHPEPEPENQP